MRGVRHLVSTLALLAAAGCARGPDPVLTPASQTPSRESYDPSSGCQRALSHFIDLAVEATGNGPMDGQRGEFVRRCVAAASDRASGCVLELRRLPGRRGGRVGMQPIWACLSRR